MVTHRYLACCLCAGLAWLFASAARDAAAAPAAFLPASAAAALDRDGNRLDDALDAALRSLPPGRDPVVSIEVLFRDDPSESAIAAFAALGGQVTHRYRAMGHGWTGSLPLRQVPAVRDAAGPGLVLVGAARPIRMHMDEATRTGRVRSVWSQGLVGSSSTTIGILDSGVDSTHADLAGRMAYWHDYTADGAASPEDRVGHGTLLAGIAAGSGAASAATPRVLPFTASGDASGLAVGDFVPAYIHTPATGYTTWSMTAAWQGGGSAHLYAVRRPNGGGSLSVMSTWLGASPLAANFTNFVPPAANRFTPALLKTAGMGGYAVASSFPFAAVGDGFPSEQGCAPGARWAGFKVIDRTGAGTDLTAAAALDDAVALGPSLGLKTLVLSFGVPGGSPLLRARVNACAGAGILVCCSSGNDGRAAMVGDPAAAWGALTVGATGDTNQVTQYTSSGTSTPDADGDIKPDLLAPGGSDLHSHIVSADSNSADAGGLLADLRRDDYACGKGSSISAAFAAGAAALVIQALEQAGHTWDWGGSGSPMLAKMLLCATSTEVNAPREENQVDTPPLGRGDTPKDRHEGYGILNPDAATEAAGLAGAWDTPITGTTAGGAMDRRCWARRFSLQSASPHLFALDVPADADYDLYLYGPAPDPKGNPVLLAYSCATAAGAGESIAYTPAAAGEVILVVKRVSGAGQWSLVATRPPQLAVTSPNGGEEWPLAGTRTIAWTQQSLGGAGLRIDLLRDGVPVAAVADPVPASAGSYRWSIPNALAPGGGYAIRVTNPATGLADVSDAPFSLVPITTSLTVADTDGSPAATVSLSALLLTVEGAPLPVGSVVEFAVDGAVVGSASTGAVGSAVLAYPVDVAAALGAHSIAASYSGTAAYLAATGTATLAVGPSPTALRLHAPDAAAAGAYLRIYSYLLRRADGAMLAGRTVRYRLDGQDAGQSVTDANGYSEVWAPVPVGRSPGSAAVAALFDGDTRDQACSAGSSATITAGDPVSLYVNSPSGGMGGTVALYAYLWRTADHAMLTGKAIEFHVDGLRVGTGKTDGNGYARVSYKIPVGTPAGSHPLQARFLGDGSCRAQSRSSTLTTAAGWATVLSTPSRQGVQGLPVTLYAYLWRADDHAMLQGREVRFLRAGVLVGSAITDANGYARVVYSVPPGTPAGTYGIEVRFDGAGELEPASAIQVLSVAVRDTLDWYVADRTAPVLGRTILYTYIRSRATGRPVAGLTIQFRVDGVPVGAAVSATDGYAACAYVVPPGTATGAHAILAEFAGDSAYEPGSKGGSLQVP